MDRCGDRWMDRWRIERADTIRVKWKRRAARSEVHCHRFRWIARLPSSFSLPPIPCTTVKRYVPAHLHTRVRVRACECAKDAAEGKRGGVIGIIIQQYNLAL